MKKKNNLLTLIALIVVALAIVTALAPIGVGVTVKSNFVTDALTGYDFVFGNTASYYTKTPTAGLIAAFVLNLVGGVFGLLGLIFVLPQGTKKFGSFLLFVAGLALAATGILYFLALPIAGLHSDEFKTFSLEIGFILAGAAGALSGVLALVGGFAGMAKKN